MMLAFMVEGKARAVPAAREPAAATAGPRVWEEVDTEDWTHVEENLMPNGKQRCNNFKWFQVSWATDALTYCCKEPYWFWHVAGKDFRILLTLTLDLCFYSMIKREQQTIQ